MAAKAAIGLKGLKCYFFSLLVKVGASPDSVPSRQSMSQ